MRITDEQKERAAYVNLPQFLMAHGFDLKKVGREYVWKEHDSLHIKDNGPGERGAWFRFSEDKGGDNIGFLREYMGMSFVEAVEALTGEPIDRTYIPQHTYQPKPVQQKARELSLAEADNARRVFAYLCKTRGLDYDMVSALVRGGSVSQEEKTGNVLFKYYDEQGKVIGAEKVGTSTEKKFKGIATGSAGGHGFEVVRGSGEKAFFFESAIDMLSYLQMHDRELENCRLVSMMGVKPNIVLDTMLRHNISPENVFLCSDNDQAGNDFAQRLQEQYPEMKRVITPDTYKDWNDMLRGIPKVVEHETEKKEVQQTNMQYYGNEMWNKATDNRDKSLVSVQAADFARLQEQLERSGINYYAYARGNTVIMAINDKDVDWFKRIAGTPDLVPSKSNRPYSPPEKNIFGSAEYRYIPQKEYFSADRDLVLKMADIMARRGMQFSGRVYPSGKGTLTVSRDDLYTVRSIRDEVVNMRRQFASPDRAQEVGNRDYRANRDTHYYMSKLTPEQFKEIKPFLETSVSYHAVSRDGKVAFAVDKENAPAFHRALENAVREVGMLHRMADLGLTMEQNVALSPTIHRLAVENMQIDLANFFDSRYDEAQFGEMLSLVEAYIAQATAERYGEHSKLNDMLEAKSSFDRAIELSDFFSQHDFSDEQRAAITAMFVGDVTRGQLESIDETFTAEDIQAYDEVLHNALQESDVTDFLTAHKQAVIDRENSSRVPTEEEVLFPKADLAKFIAERTPSSDEWEDMAYPLFENGYLDTHKPSDRAAYGYHMSEQQLYDIAQRYHDGEDIRRELALGLLEGGNSADIEFVFEQGKMSDRTYYYAEHLRHSLHLERTEDGYNCTFDGMERFVSFEEIGQAFIDRIHEEFDDLMYWRVLDYIRDDIPDISDETVQQLMTAFDGAALHGWEEGDNQPKINRIKKALYEILGDEEQTEKAFACIAKQKYNVSFEPKQKESSIHFGLFGNGVTAYDISRTDPETHDYPIVAHISAEGVIDRMDDDLSTDDKALITAHADSVRAEFMERWNARSDEEKYALMTARLSLTDPEDYQTWQNILAENGLSKGEIVEKYMPYIMFGEGERPEPKQEKVQEKSAPTVADLEVGDIIMYDGVRREIEEISDERIKMRDLDAPDYGGILLSTSDVLSYDGWQQDMEEKGFEILYKGEKTEAEREMSPLDRAINLINDFCVDEYSAEADFSDMSNISLAYTTDEQYELPIQVTADLVDFKISYEFDGEVYNTEQYDSIEDMIENGLTGLDFNELVSVPDEVIERHIAKDEVTVDEQPEAEIDEDAPLFSDTSVIEEIQRNETSDVPFWETTDVQGEQLSLFGDPEPIQQTKPEKPKSEFAKGPVVDGVQVYEALAAEIDRGTGFVNGKLRVQEFYDEQHPTLQQLADFLKKEYGIGGHSGEGNISLVDYDSKGLTFSFENGEKFRHSWHDVAVMTETRLRTDTYLSAEQKEQYAQQMAEKSTLNPVDSKLEEVDDSVKIGDKFRNRLTGDISEVVSLEGAIPWQTDDVTITTDKGSYAITESISVDRLLDTSLYERVTEPERTAEVDKAVPEKADTEQTAELPTPKNLSQLKKAIQPGMMFEITDHQRPECVGECRVVTGVSSVDFTSRKLDENGEPTGKDIHMDFDRAKNWSFDGAEMTSHLDKGEVLMSFHFIDGLERDISAPEQTAEADIEADRAFLSQVIEKFGEHYDDMYQNNDDVIGYSEAITVGDEFIKDNPEFMSRLAEQRGDIITSDRETAALAFALVDVGLLEKFTHEPEKAAEKSAPTLEVGDTIEYKGKEYQVESLDMDGYITLINPEINGTIKDRVTFIADEFINSGEYKVITPDVDKAPEKGDNFTITDDSLGEGGAKAKFRANVDAIKTLKLLEMTGRSATTKEQETLSKYVGWGALPQAFDKNDSKWTVEYTELKDLLTPQEYAAARATVL